MSFHSTYTMYSVCSFINNAINGLTTHFLDCILRISKQLCLRYGLNASTWQSRNISLRYITPLLGVVGKSAGSRHEASPVTLRREHLESDAHLEHRQDYEVTKKAHCGIPDGLQTHQGLVRSAPTTVTTLASAIDYETSLDIYRAIVRMFYSVKDWSAVNYNIWMLSTRYLDQRLCTNTETNMRASPTSSQRHFLRLYPALSLGRCHSPPHPQAKSRCPVFTCWCL